MTSPSNSSERFRQRLYILIMGLTACLVGGATFHFLYSAAYDQQQERLRSMALNQATLLEALIRLQSPGPRKSGADRGGLARVRESFQYFHGFGDTGELVLAEKQDNRVFFLVRSHERSRGSPAYLHFGDKSAEPMQRALRGEAGIMTGRDYRGRKVLAAYRPLSLSNLGLVVKIDIQEIRSPFIRSGIVAGGVSLVFILLGSLAFKLLSDPQFKQLRKNKEILEKIFNSAHILIAYLDTNFNFIRVNRAYAKADEKTPGYFTGKNHFDLFPNEENQLIFQRTLETGEAHFAQARAFEYEHNPERGVTHWDWTLHPVTDEEGRVEGLLLLLVDVTKRVQAEEELRTLNEQLELRVEERGAELRRAHQTLVKKERLAVLGQLTATVSHELRNPLGAMWPSLYIIRSRVKSRDEQVDRAMTRIDRNIARCDRIIDELLDFTRETEIAPRAVRLEDWLNSIVEEQNINPRIKIEKNFNPPPGEIYFDPERLRRALINLIENACHSMMKDDCQDETLPGSRLIISVETRGEYVALSVEDNGAGIDPEILPRIFEPLFSTKGFGVGLGLPAVRQIMTLHGGDIEIDSRLDRGTRITLLLPARFSADINKSA